MLAEGIGEKLTRLNDLDGVNLVIAKPEAGVSTKYVYETLDSLSDPFHPDVDGMLGVIEKYAKAEAKTETKAEAETNPVKEITRYLGNSLESVTIPACPEVEKIKQLLLGYGALGTLMSGSGPTVFAVFASEKEALEAAGKLSENPDSPAKDIFVTKTVGKTI